MTKKSSKKGPTILDPVKDFEQPVRKDPSSQETQQENLPGVEQGESAPPPSVNGKKCVAHFVRLRPEQDEGQRFLHFEMALQLSQEVTEILPEIFQDAWSTLSNDSAIKRLDLACEDPMNWNIYLEPGDEAPATLIGLVPRKVRVQSVEETGSTKSRQVIRLSFAIVIPQDYILARWALENHGNLVWLEVEETNRRLPLGRRAAV